MVHQPGEFGENDAQILGAFRNFDSSQFFDTERIGTVVRHGTKVIESVGIRHGGEITRVLADLFMVAMEIAKNRLELADDFAVERHIHPKDAVRGWVLWTH